MIAAPPTRRAPVVVALVVAASTALAAETAAPDPRAPGFEIQDCLGADRGALVATLRELRASHVRQVEDRGHRRAWRQVERDLGDASDDGRALVEAWLDSPELALRRFGYDDELPLPRGGLDPIEFVRAGLSHLGHAWRSAAIGADLADGDREAALARIDAIPRVLLQRFDAMFDNRRPDVEAARADLEQRVEAFRAEFIEPWQLGRSAAGTTALFVPDPAELDVPEVTIENLPIFANFVAWFEEILPSPPDMSPPRPFADMDYEPGVRAPLFADTGLRRGNVDQDPTTLAEAAGAPQSQDLVSGSIPDPRDVAEALRIQASWFRQRKIVAGEIRAEQRELGRIERTLRDDALGLDELDRLARDAERSRRRLSRLSEDATRLMVRVQAPQASRPWVEDMLRGQEKLRAVTALRADDRTAVEEARKAERLIADSVSRGAVPPPTGARPGSGDGSDGSGTERSSGAGQAIAGSGAGLAPASDAPSASHHSATLDGILSEGLTWRGPLPLPDARWSDAVVAALRATHADLDDVDARILLGLIEAALGSSGPADVEGLVFEMLESGRLTLRGGESGLSELSVPGRPLSEQPEVLFVLEGAPGH